MCEKLERPGCKELDVPKPDKKSQEGEGPWLPNRQWCKNAKQAANGTTTKNRNQTPEQAHSPKFKGGGAVKKKKMVDVTPKVTSFKSPRLSKKKKELDRSKMKNFWSNFLTGGNIEAAIATNTHEINPSLSRLVARASQPDVRRPTEPVRPSVGRTVEAPDWPNWSSLPEPDQSPPS